MLRNVHGPTYETNKPMVKIVPKGELAEAPVNDKMCSVCNAQFLPQVWGKEEKILVHLRDVHDILEPKTLEHYC
ncbi:hypothetical protein FRC07_008114 [Ceratobasidium sp. 392]|nr:hypothetical protein FRC07_008114 [Ceratobasidium sp. 392]